MQACPIRLGILCLLLFFASARCPAGETIDIVKLSATDHSAVIRTADGSLAVVREGDFLDSCGTVRMIDERRVIVESVGSRGRQRIIFTLDDDRTRIQRISTVTAEKQVSHRPAQSSAGH
jgi:hypothetical protein